MNNGNEAGPQTFDSSSDTIDLGFRQKRTMDPQEIETPADGLTHRSIEERIKQAVDPILRQVEEIFDLLVSRTELESAGNSEASRSRRERRPLAPCVPGTTPIIGLSNQFSRPFILHFFPLFIGNPQCSWGEFTTQYFSS